MNYILLVLISLIGNFSFSQTTIHGYCVLHKTEDSSTVMNRYFSTEKFNENGENVYEKIFPFGNPDSIYFIEYNIGNSSNYIKENVHGADTSRYYYINDTLNLRSYITVGSDTSMTFKTTFENGHMVASECIFGCDYREVIHSNARGKEDTIITIWQDGDSTYTIRVHDTNYRQVLFKSFLNSPDALPTEHFRSIYNDSLNTQTDILESPGWVDDLSTEITYFDTSKLPIKKEIILVRDGKMDYWLIEYRRE